MDGKGEICGETPGEGSRITSTGDECEGQHEKPGTVVLFLPQVRQNMKLSM